MEERLNRLQKKGVITLYSKHLFYALRKKKLPENKIKFIGYTTKHIFYSHCGVLGKMSVQDAESVLNFDQSFLK